MDEVARMRAIIGAQNEIIAAGSSMASVMQIVTDQALGLTNSSGAVVELAEGDDMVYAATAGTVKGKEGLRLNIHNSLSGLCVRTGEILIAHDTEVDPRVDAEACRRVDARSMIVVPLISREATVGVLKVLSSKANNFDDEDVELLKTLANFIASAIAQASLLEQSRRDALTDTLTGLENRADFMHHLDAALARADRNGAVVYVLYLDLNGFKPINDTYGHQAGDHVLKVIGKRLSRTIRKGEHVARLGGDEFAVIAEDHTSEPIDAFQSRLINEIKRPIEYQGQTLFVSASVGVATAHGKDVAESILARADAAMYAMKRKRSA